MSSRLLFQIGYDMMKFKSDKMRQTWEDEMEIVTQTASLLDSIREKTPLIHHITNYVTVNDCANVVLAIGASPIMADDAGEVEEVVALADALVLNMGTLNQRTVPSMTAAGKRANELGIPVIFDPVGVGISDLRKSTAQKICREVKISILRGNLSEVSFLAGANSTARGVDTAKADEKNDPRSVAKKLSESLKCVVAVTGAEDVITDGTRVIRIGNGHPMLSKVTGTGCMTTSLVGACAGTAEDYLAAAVGGVASMGIAGELAYEKAGANGTGSFHIEIIDALSQMSGETFRKMAKIKEG